MTPQMIYLVGQPGSGKSTLMEKLTSPFDLLERETPVPHIGLIDRQTGAVIGAEIGRRRDAFSGTDALASAIIDKAVPWIESHPYPLVLGEGARLGNARFLNAAIDAGYAVTLALLDHDQAEDWRIARSKKLKRTQNESWVKGRRSASRNLANAMQGRARVWRGHPDDLGQGLWETITDG